MRPVDEIQQVDARLVIWQGYDPSSRVDLTSSALVLPDGLLLVDPIGLAPAARQHLLALGSPLAVVCTSANHARAAESWRQRHGIPVLCHPAAVPGLEVRPDREISGGPLSLGGVELTVLEVPGAAPGEIALLDPREPGWLIVGDALIHLDSTGFARLPDRYCEDPRELARSLAALAEHPFGALAFAHGLPIVRDARTRLEALLGEV